MTIYCTYLTSYSGNKLPQFYIGSSSTKRIEEGYHGTVTSKKYKTIWNQEIFNNPQLFKTKIISTHNTRDEALSKEKDLQVKLNVVKSPMYINESLAQINGFFGRDVSGKNNPNYNNKWTKDQRNKSSIKNKEFYKNNPKVWVSNLEGKSKHIYKKDLDNYLANGWFRKRNLETKNIIIQGKLKFENMNHLKCCCLICGKEQQVHILESHILKKHTFKSIEYFGEYYYGYNDLENKTGCTTKLYIKYYLNGLDPRDRIGKNGPPPKNYIFKKL
jgi:hypothetical protein